MTLTTNLVAAALAGAVFLASAAVALAGQPAMGHDADLYSTPGGEVVDQIDGGDNISVGHCQGGYCYVRDLDDHSKAGWVKAATISLSGNDDDDTGVYDPTGNTGIVDLDDLPNEHHHHKSL